MDAGEHQNLLQWGMQKPQQEHTSPLELLCDTHWSGDTGQSLEQAEGLPHRAGSWSSPHPCSWRGGLLTQVLLPHSGMLVLGPRQCGNRIRAARQRLSTPAKECERLRRRRGSCQGIPAALSSPGKGQSLQVTLCRALGTAHQLPRMWSQRGFSLASHFPPHPKKKKGLLFPPHGVVGEETGY